MCGWVRPLIENSTIFLFFLLKPCLNVSTLYRVKKCIFKSRSKLLENDFKLIKFLIFSRFLDFRRVGCKCSVLQWFCSVLLLNCEKSATPKNLNFLPLVGESAKFCKTSLDFNYVKPCLVYYYYYASFYFKFKK